MKIHTIFLLIMLQNLYRLGDSRPIPGQHQPTPVQIQRKNSTNNVQIERSNSTNNVQIEKSNTRKNRSGNALEQMAMFSKLNFKVKHIPRQKRQSFVPADFDLLHAGCELDIVLANNILTRRHCRQIYDHRFTNAESWKALRHSQLESFMFGQHYERFKRYETEQHTFEES